MEALTFFILLIFLNLLLYFLMDDKEDGPVVGPLVAIISTIWEVLGDDDAPPK